jgi:hypothetical protein
MNTAWQNEQSRPPVPTTDGGGTDEHEMGKRSSFLQLQMEAEILKAKKLIFSEKEIPNNVSIKALMNIIRHISKSAGMPYKYQTDLKDVNVRKAYEKYRSSIGEYNFPMSDEQRLDFDFLYLIDLAQDEKEKERLILQRNEKAKAMELYKLLQLWELRKKAEREIIYV